MTDRHQPSAAAARRARQIGGGVRPRPTPAADTASATDTASVIDTDTASTDAASTDTASTDTASTDTASTDAAVEEVSRAPTGIKAEVEVDTAAAQPAARRADRAKKPPAAAGRTDAAPGAGVATGDAATTDSESPADAAASDTAASDTAASDVSARSGNRAFRVGALVLTALLLAWGVLLAVVLFGHQCVGPLHGCTVRSTEPTDRAVAAAKTDVALLTSYSYQSIDSDAAKTSAVLTGEFKSQYDKSIQDVVKPQLPTTQTVSTGQVSTAGVESANTAGNQVVVVVYGQQAVTNKAQTTPRIDPFQLRVTMSLAGDRWLISAVVQLGNQS